MLYSFSFFVGIVLLLAAPALPPAWVALPVAAVALVSGMCCRHLLLAVAVCGACCGFLFAGYHARDYLAHRWPGGLSDERVIASVVVDSIPARIDSGWSFDATLRIEAPEKSPAAAYTGWGDELRVRLVTRDASFHPRAGERWRLLVALRSPRGRANPGAPDFERHQFRDEVHALGAVIGSGINRRLDFGHHPLDALRERISEHIEAQVADRDAAALIAALAVGDTGRVSREQWRVYNATGTTHLVAISGMHVTLFAVIAFAAARWFWAGTVWVGANLPRSPLRRAAAWISKWPRETFAAVVGLAAATAYAMLAGLSVPTQRTLIMLGVWLLARSVARASRPFQPFALALLAVLLLDPFAPLSAGFWLSFIAMGAIILTTTGRFLRRPLLLEALSVQAVVTVALLPFSLALFGSVSVIGPAVNLLAIPAMSWVLVPTVLASVALLPVSSSASNGVLAVAAWLHDQGWPWLAAASDVPWALLHASPPWWWYAIAIFALAFALLPWPLLMRFAAAVCVVPLATAIERPLESGQAEVTVLDVGEGTAVVVRTAGHVLVHGTGDSYGTGGRIAETVVAPYLRSVGARAIDRAVLERVSTAAAEGLVALWAEMPILQTLVGQAPVDEGDGAAEAGSRDDSSTRYCASEPHPWQWDGVTFQFREPDASHACTLSVSAGRGEVLIQADVTAIDAAAGGRWLVVSGRRAQRSVAKFALLHRELEGATVLSTADSGAIRVLLDGASGPGDPEAWRAHRRTLWSASP
jgi:competence protein ComEC